MKISRDPLIGPETIAQKVKELADRIAWEYNGKHLTYVGIMGGAFVFLSDLMRTAGLDSAVDFLWLASYDGDESTGRIKVLRDLSESPLEKNVLLVDGILDSGRTLAYARELLLNRGAADVKIAVLLQKQAPRTADVQADFVGFSIENRFVVGYGLDYCGRFRHLNGIHVMEDDS